MTLAWLGVEAAPALLADPGSIVAALLAQAWRWLGPRLGYLRYLKTKHVTLVQFVIAVYGYASTLYFIYKVDDLPHCCGRSVTGVLDYLLGSYFSAAILFLQLLNFVVRYDWVFSHVLLVLANTGCVLHNHFVITDIGPTDRLYIPMAMIGVSLSLLSAFNHVRNLKADSAAGTATATGKTTGEGSGEMYKKFLFYLLAASILGFISYVISFLALARDSGVPHRFSAESWVATKAASCGAYEGYIDPIEYAPRLGGTVTQFCPHDDKDPDFCCDWSVE